MGAYAVVISHAAPSSSVKARIVCDKERWRNLIFGCDGDEQQRYFAIVEAAPKHQRRETASCHF
ncbi:hypothetical protein GE107_17995 [Cohnella sp. CFH 77786]|uniref:hypothetical protein n=1 Tax=Cohnella sp. CFH 77786 TaxID=2662265 RepID=UPI001C6083A3|nr:hypothetical protein [Cohnella sp. CFH 77786]MBW5447950.1 hypothetical protein [Cohnella sp. CFH 77786]